MTENLTLDGRAVIVTGATTDSGRAVIAALAAAGANIVAVDPDQEPLDALAGDIAAQGATGRVLAMAADLHRPEICRRLVSRSALAFGEINGLVIHAYRDMFRSTPPRQTTILSSAAPTVTAPPNGEPADISLALAMPAACRFNRQGWGRVIVAADDAANATPAAWVTDWARDLENTGVTANLLIAGVPPPGGLAAAVCWLMSEDSDGFNGGRLQASEWDPALPAAEAASRSTRPIA